MKSAIKFKDANKPWLPQFGMVNLIPNPKNKRPLARTLISTGSPVDGGNQSAAISEFIDGLARVTAQMQAKDHPWDVRRADVIAEFKDRIIEHRTPRGFTEAWRPEDHDVATTELAWLEATQEQELPPEWLTMRSNGTRGESLDALVETDDGKYTQADLLPDGAYTMHDSIHTYELVGGMRQIEAFLKESDHQKWYTGRTRRYQLVVNEEGKRGIVRLNRSTTEKQMMSDWDVIRTHLPSVEDIEASMEFRDAHVETYQDKGGRTRTRFIDGTFASREHLPTKMHERLLDDVESERDLTEYRVAEQEDGYKPSTPCPNPVCESRGDDCRVCYGSGYILHTLGMDVEMDSTYSTWREEKRARVRWSKSIRQSIDRLSKDSRDIAAFGSK